MKRNGGGVPVVLEVQAAVVAVADAAAERFPPASKAWTPIV